MLDFEKKKILWVYYTNEYAWDGEIVGYINKNNNKLLSKKQYNKMIEREIREKWKYMDLEELVNYGNFDFFRIHMLNNIDIDYNALVEIIIDENDDIEKYNPYLEMHWLEVLALENEKSIYQIAKKGGLSTSTLYTMIDKDTQICDISIKTLSKILKGLNISLNDFVDKYDNRFFITKN